MKIFNHYSPPRTTVEYEFTKEEIVVILKNHIKSTGKLVPIEAKEYLCGMDDQRERMREIGGIYDSESFYMFEPVLTLRITKEGT